MHCDCQGSKRQARLHVACRRMLAHQLLQLGGRGIFEWHPVLLSLYYRLGGAKIGKGVKIHLKAQISDFDLVTIADNVAVDAALVSPQPLQFFCTEDLLRTWHANCR